MTASSIPRPKRVVLVVGQLHTGGTERQVLGLAQHLPDRGTDLHVVCASDRLKPFGFHIRSEGIPVTVLGASRSNVFQRTRGLVEVLQSWYPDVLHSFGDAAGVFSLVANRSLGLPHVHAVRSQLAYRRPTQKLAALTCCRCADLVTTNSGVLCEEIRRWSRLPPSRLAITPNGISPGRFVGLDISDVDRCVNGRGSRLVLYVGRAHTAKDLPTLARTLLVLDSLVRRRSERIVVALLGSGLEPLQRSLAGRLTAVRLCAPGPVDPIEPWFVACDALLLTSRAEGMPNAVLEAMAAARPVVATDVGGCRELVHDGVTGRLVPPSAPEHTARALLGILSDPDRSRRMGRAGMDVVTQSYGWGRSCEATEAAYRRATVMRSLGGGIRSRGGRRRFRAERVGGQQGIRDE